MIRRYVGVRTANDFVLFKPFLVEWTENAKRVHVVISEEYIVYDAFEIVPAMRETSEFKNSRFGQIQQQREKRQEGTKRTCS